MKTTSSLFVTLLVMLASQVHGLEAKAISEAIKEGEVKVDFRYRYEFVDQDGIDEEAKASTLKGRLSYTTKPLSGWVFGAEADYTALIGSEKYNSTVNGNTEYPVVADPEGFDLNQFFAKYKSEQLTFTGGRQRIVHADQRFVGGVAWRQNEQTYDAARFEFKAGEKISFDYSYVWNVNRIFGPDDGAQPADWRSNSHMLKVTFAAAEKHKVDAYAYLLDFENDNGIPNSTATYGIAYNGSFGPVKVAAAYATQSDYADSALDYDADFYAIDLSTKIEKVSLNLGWQVLGSEDGVAAFRTPLATLHKFQGWADKFLLTPAAGLEDTYAGISGALGKLKLAATYHEFSADEGSADFGDEINVVATYPINKTTSVQLKYADYSADEFATDTTKFWLTLNVKF